VVIDDNVAYCGGIDLTVRRWDTAAHHPAEPKRRFRDPKPYTATHDVQMVVDGHAAAALGEWIRERWLHAGGKACAPVHPSGDAWPEQVIPDFTDVHVGVMRTIAALDDRAADILEIERATVGAISRAERFVYIENQYITSKAAYDALHARMRAVPALEAIVVTSHDPGGWLEARIMGAGRQRFMAAFAEPELAARIHFVSPSVACEGADVAAIAATLHIHVHAKVLIVDDWFLRIGSSNLNNRSMGFDTECDLAIEAQNREQRAAITAVRNRLIAEHWGSEAASVDKA
jgi:phospholipase D1/2